MAKVYQSCTNHILAHWKGHPTLPKIICAFTEWSRCYWWGRAEGMCGILDDPINQHSSKTEVHFGNFFCQNTCWCVRICKHDSTACKLSYQIILLGHSLITAYNWQHCLRTCLADCFWDILTCQHIFDSRSLGFHEKAVWNPLSHDMKMHILLTDLHTFLVELVRRICLHIKTSHPWWSLSLFLSLECLNK